MQITENETAISPSYIFRICLRINLHILVWQWTGIMIIVDWINVHQPIIYLHFPAHFSNSEKMQFVICKKSIKSTRLDGKICCIICTLTLSFFVQSARETCYARIMIPVGDGGRDRMRNEDGQDDMISEHQPGGGCCC